MGKTQRQKLRNKHCNSIEKTNYKSCLEDVAKVLTGEEREVILNYCRDNLKQNHSRRAYKELLQQVISFLGRTVPNFNTFRIPVQLLMLDGCQKRFIHLKFICFAINSI